MNSFTDLILIGNISDGLRPILLHPGHGGAPHFVTLLALHYGLVSPDFARLQESIHLLL